MASPTPRVQRHSPTHPHASERSDSRSHRPSRSRPVRAPQLPIIPHRATPRHLHLDLPAINAPIHVSREEARVRTRRATAVLSATPAQTPDPWTAGSWASSTRHQSSVGRSPRPQPAPVAFGASCACSGSEPERRAGHLPTQQTRPPTADATDRVLAGTRLSPWVSLGCMLMSGTVLFF